MSRAKCRISCYGRLAMNLPVVKVMMVAAAKRGIARPPRCDRLECPFGKAARDRGKRLGTPRGGTTNNV